MARTNLPRDEKGVLESYAWPGGYQIMYLDRENSVICPDCARASEESESGQPESWFYMDCGEDPETCEECGQTFPEPEPVIPDGGPKIMEDGTCSDCGKGYPHKPNCGKAH